MIILPEHVLNMIFFLRKFKPILNFIKTVDKTKIISKMSSNLPILNKNNTQQRNSSAQRVVSPLILADKFNEQLVSQLSQEKNDYTTLANHLIEKTTSVLNSNDTLEHEIETTNAKIQHLNDLIQQYKKQNSYNLKKKEKATYRLKRYQDKYSKSFDGSLNDDIEQKIQQQREEIDRLRTQYTALETKFKKEQEMVKVIVEYNNTSREMILMNKDLYDEAWRLLGLLEKRKGEFPDAYNHLFYFLRSQIQKQQAEANFIVNGNIDYGTDNNDDIFAELDRKLDAASPYFNELQGLIEHPSRQQSGISSTLQSSTFLSTHESEPAIGTKPHIKSTSVISSPHGTTNPAGFNENGVRNPRLNNVIRKIKDGQKGSQKRNVSKSRGNQIRKYNSNLSEVATNAPPLANDDENMSSASLFDEYKDENDENNSQTSEKSKRSSKRENNNQNNSDNDAEDIKMIRTSLLESQLEQADDEGDGMMQAIVQSNNNNQNGRVSAFKSTEDVALDQTIIENVN